MKPPRFWADPAGGGLAGALLSPLGAVYAAAGARRIVAAKPYQPPVPVICIGNLTLGGTGKTPVAIAALARLRERGVNAHGLSRGYKGRLKGPDCVDLQRHTARDAGDEALLIAAHGPVWVGRDRAAAARAAVLHEAEALVMDDGHQNSSLRKDMSIVVIDAEAGWGNGRVFPAGPLREPVQAGLARADAVVLMTPGEDHAPDYRQLGLDELQKPVLRAWLTPEGPPPDGPLLAFAGIGRPEKFFAALARAGGDVADTAAFADHHAFTARDLSSLADLAAAHGAKLITTAKDHVRLPADWRMRVTAWPVQAAFANPAAFDALLQAAMDAAASRR